MAEKIKGFTVTLKKPMRIENAEPIMNAISLLTNVCDVCASNDTLEDHMNRMVIKDEIRRKMWSAIEEI